MALCSNGDEMINIHKLIKAVKKGTLSFDPFNLRIKRADSLQEQQSDQAEIDRINRNIVEQKQRADEKSQKDAFESGQTDAVDVPQDFAMKVNDFLDRYREDIENLARTGVIEDSQFLADTSLYNAMRYNRSYQNAMIQSITQQTAVTDPDVARKVVDVINAKSEDIKRQFQQRKQEGEAAIREQVGHATFDEAGPSAWALEQQKKQQGEGYVERAEESIVEQEEQPVEKEDYNIKDYSKPVKWPDPHIEFEFITRYNNATPEEKSVAQKIIGAKHIRTEDFELQEVPEALSDAAVYKLGAPSDKAWADQRMNFFLAFPQHFTIDADLMQAFSEGLQQIKVDLGTDQLENVSTNIHSILDDKQRDPRTHRTLMNILNNERAPALYETLKGLVEEQNPDIYKWLSPVVNSEKLGVSWNDGVGGAGVANMGLTPGGKKDAPIVMDAYEQHQYSNVLGKISGVYVAPMVEDAHEVMKSALGDMRVDTIDKFKQIQQMEMPVDKQAKKDFVRDKKMIVEQYDIAEAMHAFGIPIMAHVSTLLASKSKLVGGDEEENPLMAIYKTKEGSIRIPETIVQDIIKKLPGEAEIPLEDTNALAKRYIQRMKVGTAAPYMPDWNKLVTHQYPVEIFQRMGNIKKKIREYANSIKKKYDVSDTMSDAAKEEAITGDVRVHFGDQVSDFAGVSLDDKESIKRKKEEDFIYMTLNQSNAHVNWLTDLGSRKEGKILKNVAEGGRNAHHNLKAFMQDHSYKSFGYLANKKDAALYVEEAKELMEKMTHRGHNPTSREIKLMNAAQNFTDEDIEMAKDYTDDALSTVLGIFGNHSNMRKFRRSGSSINAADKKGRTNTELYYYLRGEKMPEHIGTLADIYKKGIEQSTQIDNRTGEPKIEKGSWFHTFFNKFEEFDKTDEAREEMASGLEQNDVTLEGKYKQYSGKVLKLIRHPDRQDADYNDRMKMIRKGKKGDDFEAKQRNALLADNIQVKVDKWLKETDGQGDLDADVLGIFYGKFTKALDDHKAVKAKITDGYDAPFRGKMRRYPGIEELKLKDKGIAAVLNKMLVDSGFPEQEILPLQKSLKLVREAYNRVVIKIAALEKMKKHNVKFSSVNNIDYIDLQIARVKTEFDNYFNSLFL